MFKKVLIANRGEIALRIIRSCHELGIKTVAIHSTVDSDAMHVRLSDESVCVGPPQAEKSYLNIPAIVTAAEISGADAIHPGYGFLSENAKFAEIVEEHGINFIGPKAEHINTMGDKISARKAMNAAGVPLVPGSDGSLSSKNELLMLAKKIGFPLIIKASAGGGGKGMKIINHEEDIKKNYDIAKYEAKANFGNDSIYAEKFLKKPKHIEFQIFADNYGNVVHLGERDCSIQRRHQKVLEEAPANILNKKDRESIFEVVINAIKKIGYRGAGTFEMLYEEGKFYFIEMNTRLQVEHPVTEMITGIDIVTEQIRVASGEKLSFKQKDITFNGHSIECRINAENSLTFNPSPGKIKTYHTPGGIGVRIDSALYQGYKVVPHYDSLIAKLVVHGSDRKQAVSRLKRALKEYIIEGIETTLDLHDIIINSEDFINYNYDIHWLEKLIASKNK